MVWSFIGFVTILHSVEVKRNIADNATRMHHYLFLSW